MSLNVCHVSLVVIRIVSISKLRIFFYTFDCPLFTHLKSIIMANLIVVTSFSKLTYQENNGTTATPLVLNVKNIISVSTRPVAYQTTGISTILYELPYNQARLQISLIVTEAVAAIVTAANT